jgi:hypothetical protein
MNNKAQTHVEIILSFVLFVGVLIFIFIFINPFSTKESTSVIGNVQNKIINNISSEVGKLSVILNETTSECYNFSELDYPGPALEVKETDRKFSIYFSEEFPSTDTPHKSVTSPNVNYTLGVFSKEKYIFYENIEKLKGQYDNDYSSLISSIGVPNGFSFNVSYANRTGIKELEVVKNIPEGIDVESRDIPIRSINKQGEILELIFNIRVW